MGWEHLRVSYDDDVATLTLDRPSRRNAMHEPLWDELPDAARAIAARGPRVVLLTGAGDHFSAGMDLRPDNPLVERLAPLVASKDRTGLRRVIEGLKASIQAVADLPCPVVAAIEGACVGSGLELALAADLRVAGQGARFALPETRWGLAPDVGGTVRLARLIGRARATDLILTGREASAGEALGWGLVNRVVPAGTSLQAADALARSICRGAPVATGAVLDVLRQLDSLDDAQALQAETQAGVKTLVGGEVLEGLSAFANRKEPRWSGLN